MGFCPTCGTPMTVAPLPPGPFPPVPRRVNTHTEGFIVLAFLLSFLWFRINGVAVVPLGLLGGLVVAWWSQDIDRSVGKPSQFALAAVLGVVGALIGFFL